ncbi:MAG TPA: Ig-like domain repeat protein [Mycobacteriales bacterium]|nr:Ig-like domain repeat protein [Mycobacteriales bacterium]
MRSRRLVAVVSTVAITGGTIAGAAASAHAATSNPIKASLLGVRDVMSGTSSFHLDVRVTNPLPPTGTDVANYVRVTLPPTLTVVSGSGNGWSARIRDARSVEFDAPSVPTGSAPIAPGQKADFDIEVAAASVDQDTTGAVEVSTSSDGGTTIQDATPAGSTALTTRVYILRLTTPTLGFRTNTGAVTAGQNNVPLQVIVENHGTADVTATVTGSSASGDTFGSAPSALIPAGGSMPFTLPVTFGPAGTGRTLKVTASSPAGSNSKFTNPFEVQAPVSFVYDGSKPMTPAFGRSGGYAGFSLLLARAGAQTFTFDPTTALSFVNSADSTKSFSTPLGKSVTIAGGSYSQRIGFQSIILPGDPATGDMDGQYSPTVAISGVDGNGAPMSLQVPVSTPFVLDSLGPVAVPTLSAPHRVGRFGGSVNDTSMPYVAKNGDTLTFGGAVYTDGTATTQDPNATVKCVLDALQSGARIAEQSVSCSNSNGTITGMATPTFPSSADHAQLRVISTDSSGNTTTTTSNQIVIDNKAPQLDYALTGAGSNTTQDRDVKTVRIALREPTLGAFNPADFTVHNGSVTFPVSAVFFDGSATTFGGTIVLSLADPIGRDDTPIVDYHPPSAPPVTDAAGNLMVISSLTSHDGIAPELPVLTAVDGKSPDTTDGTFYVNNPAPPYTLGNLFQGERVTVYADTDGQPGLQSTDTTLCSTQTTGSTTTCTPTTAIQNDGTYQLLLQVVDPAGNVSAGPNGEHWSTAVLVLDRVAPTIAGFSTSASGVSVQFSEPIAGGRDAARDWSVYNGPIAYVVGSVSAPDTTDRALSINSLTWSAMASRVQYVFTGSNPLDRYVDRAGNVMPDQYYDLSTGVTLLG